MAARPLSTFTSTRITSFSLELPRLTNFDVACTAQRPFSHYRLSFCLKGKAAMAARPSSVIFIYQYRCLRCTKYLPVHQQENSPTPCYLLDRPAAMNPQVIQTQSLYLLVLRRLLPWIDLKVRKLGTQILLPPALLEF